MKKLWISKKVYSTVFRVFVVFLLVVSIIYGVTVTPIASTPVKNVILISWDNSSSSILVTLLKGEFGI